MEKIAVIMIEDLMRSGSKDVKAVMQYRKFNWISWFGVGQVWLLLVLVSITGWI